MNILGINDSHLGTACLIKDGKLSACISEERLNKIKDWAGFPTLSIKKVLEITNTKPDEVDLITFGCFQTPFTQELLKALRERKEDSIRSWKMMRLATKVTPKPILKSDLWLKAYSKLRFRGTNELHKRMRKLGFTKPKIKLYEHHLCHASTAYHLQPELKKSAIITVDAAGDGLSSTISVGKDKRIQRIEHSNTYHSLGYLYMRVTQLLGMIPSSHEYKVMGLAAYAPEKLANKSYNILKRYLRINPKNPLKLENISRVGPEQLLQKLQKELPFHRFDAISAGIQKLTEELLVKLTQNTMDHTGIKNVVCGGGVFMNVKANGKILTNTDIKDLFVFPSCGDESTAIGSAVLGHLEATDKLPEPLSQLYLGPEFSEEQIKDSIQRNNLKEKYKIEKVEDIDNYVAEKASKGKIIGRMAGRMEWGARALGNRTIISDARNPRIIDRINRAIKKRDFWMPFTPSILDENEKSYVVNPKKIKTPYMILAFDSTEKAREDIPATLHPFDRTCRPQVVEKDWNPRYYKILKRFKKITGVGGFLNTSFNLHGDSMVCSPEDAIKTFVNSDIDAIAMEDYYIQRR